MVYVQHTESIIHDILRKNPNSRISGNFGACADSVYQALLSPHEREPGFEARCISYVYSKLVYILCVNYIKILG